MTTSSVGSSTSAVARAACLAAVTELAARSDECGRAAGALGEALAAAWWVGVRDLEVLAQAAGCTAEQVGAELVALGVDASSGTLDGPAGPRFAALRAADVRLLATVAETISRPAVLTAEPGPAAEALWQLGVGLARLAEVIDPGADGEHATQMADDLVCRLREALVHVHALAAGRYTREELAAKAQQEDADRVGGGE
ncbi:hypothetical protein [Kitasatospora indigofera]|uniref:hypothetical protein n=1 Tax=Kitasatospora indigofera TaxID=67307 RepID=UPI00369F6081